jgi:hypothetical protein
MARAPFKAGDLVEIVTTDRGRGGTATNMKRRRRIERWRGVVRMPSPFLSGWWIVKKYSRNAYAGRTYSVPATEMTRISR